jgi:hypothetical protein
MPSRFVNAECSFAETPIGTVAWDPQSNLPLIDGEAQRQWEAALEDDPSIANPTPYEAPPAPEGPTGTEVAQDHEARIQSLEVQAGLRAPP